eukprot:Em0003g419a
MFPGLTSNTLYSVTMLAINYAGSTGTTVNNYTLALPPSAINGSCGQRGSSYYLNITWLPAMNVTTYQITVLDLDRGTNSTQRKLHCYIGPCYALIDLQSIVNYSKICIGSYNQINILGLKNCTPNQNIGCLRGMVYNWTQMNLVALLSFITVLVQF